MSATLGNQMIISSSSARFARVRQAFATWRRRMRDRANLTRLDDRDRRDLGLSRAAAQDEVNKPFWRA